LVDRLWKFMGRAKAVTVMVASLAVTAVCIAVLSVYWSNRVDQPAGPPPVSEAQVPGLCGWAGPDVAADEFSRLKGHFIPFLISATDGAPAVAEDRRSVLSECAVEVLGNHIPTLRQEVGDCVSMGAANAVMYLQVVAMRTGNATSFRDVFPPYLYGTSRVQIGKGRIGCKSDGSVGSWAAVAVQQYGVIASDVEGVPTYSGAIARAWGCRGPPANLLDVGKKSLVKSAAKVTTWQEARDALVNGYPITVASNVGFKMSGTMRGKKLFLPPSGSWAHQMVVIGYDNAPEACFLFLNSWGPDAHQPVNQDGPPGSFWVSAKTLQRMLAADDSYVFSSFEGFPEQDVDLDILRKKGVFREMPQRVLDVDGDGARELVPMRVKSRILEGFDPARDLDPRRTLFLSL
jgi:hypothetical protein